LDYLTNYKSMELFNFLKKPIPKPAPYSPCVTLGWDFHPTILLEGGGVLPRRAEMILNAKFYPTGTIGEWPCDPLTGEKLPIENNLKS